MDASVEQQQSVVYDIQALNQKIILDYSKQESQKLILQQVPRE
jgi:hypothetical protein